MEMYSDQEVLGYGIGLIHLNVGMYVGIPVIVIPRVEYKLTKKGQELIESITDSLEWMRKWSKKK
jgi:DNA-binding HxlR family transcriptional regulator